MRIDLQQAVALLKEQDNILILTHSHPDGDTLGCGFALCRALLRLGKKARVINADPLAPRFRFMFQGIPELDFTPGYIVAVDVADTTLLGHELEEYKDKIQLCIDHHPSNVMYAEKTLLDDSAAAACEIICAIIEALGVDFDEPMADCIYTGLSTDTGCFRYANATSKTYRLAAQMIDYGADAGEINRVMFDTKTKTYARLERLALDSLTLHFNERCAMIKITQEMYRQSGSNENETEGIASLPRQIEGVFVGATIREKENGTCKVSLRTRKPISASDICKKFGGGGHALAAGCAIHAPIDEAAAQLLAVIEQELAGYIPENQI